MVVSIEYVGRSSCRIGLFSRSFKFLILFYSIYRSDFFACVSVHHVYVVHAEDRIRCQLPLVVTMWVLETVLGSPGNAAISVNQWAVSAAPRKAFNVLSPVCTSWSPWCCYQLTLHSRTHSVGVCKVLYNANSLHHHGACYTWRNHGARGVTSVSQVLTVLLLYRSWVSLLTWSSGPRWHVSIQYGKSCWTSSFQPCGPQLPLGVPLICCPPPPSLPRNT